MIFFHGRGRGDLPGENGRPSQIVTRVIPKLQLMHHVQGWIVHYLYLFIAPIIFTC